MDFIDKWFLYRGHLWFKFEAKGLQKSGLNRQWYSYRGGYYSQLTLVRQMFG